MAQKKKLAAAAPGGGNTFVPSLDREKKKKWVRVEGIPVFDEHDGAEEGLNIQFTPQVLQKIVRQNNARIADTGDLIPVTRGHTGGPSEPEVLGWASNFRMGEVGKNRRAAILCDMQFLPEKYKTVEDMAAGAGFPRRSIELWDEDLMIDPIALTDRPLLDTIALLGADRPARNLGLGQKLQPKKYRYSIPTTEDKLTPEDIQQCVEALAQLPEFQYLRELMQSKSQMEEGEDEESSFAKEDEEEEQLQAKKCMEEEEEDDETEPAKLRLQRDQAKRKFARLKSEYAEKEQGLQAELKTLFGKVAELERKERVAQRRADLMQLEAEGYAFDLAEELDTVADMDKAQFGKHVSRMKKNYKRAPIGVKVTPAPIPAEGGRPGLPSDRAEVMRAAATKAAAQINAKGVK